MTTNAEKVDLAVDALLAAYPAGTRPTEATAALLANAAMVTREVMSGWLQDHRIRQGRGLASRGYKPRYVLSSRSYARNARWLILAKVGVDSAARQKNRRDHARWTAADIAERFAREVKHEVKAALAMLPGPTPSDELIDATITVLRLGIEAQVAAVLGVL